MVLNEVDDSIWLAEGEVVSFYGFPYPTRCVIVRLKDGDLWIWSPIKATEDVIEAVGRLGRVAHLVSPNKIHHLYLQDWKRRFPEAQLWGPRSTIDKRRDLVFREPLGDTPRPEWQADLDQAWFRGSPLLDEIVFLHRPSLTVIVADLIENFTDGFLQEHWSWWQRPIAKLIGISGNHPRAPLDWRLTVTSRARARQARQKILSWTCERVIMAHGEWRRSDGRTFLVKSLDWLGG